MIYLLGHEVQVTDIKQCQRSGIDHKKLIHEARVSRIKDGFQDVDSAFVLCLRCGKALSLNLSGELA